MCSCPRSCIFFKRNCKFHLLLIADKDLNDWFVRLDRVCITYQHVDCFCTPFKFRFRGNVLEINVERFDTVERTASFNKHNKGVNKMPSIAKNRLLRKKFKKHMLTSVQRTISVQTTGPVFMERVKSVRRKTKFELELKKNLDCFLDGYGGYERNLVLFRAKPSKKKLFLRDARDDCISRTLVWLNLRIIFFRLSKCCEICIRQLL